MGLPNEDSPVPICPFLSFPESLGIFPILSDDFPDLSFSFLRPITAPTRDSPERVRETIRTSPEKSGKPPVWNPPGLPFAKSHKSDKMPKNTTGRTSILRNEFLLSLTGK